MSIAGVVTLGLLVSTAEIVTLGLASGEAVVVPEPTITTGAAWSGPFRRGMGPRRPQAQRDAKDMLDLASILAPMLAEGWPWER